MQTLQVEPPKNLAVSSTAPTPLVFIARSYKDLSSWHWNPGLCGLAWGWDSLLPRHPSWSLSTTRECGTAHAAAVTTSPCHTMFPCLLSCLHVSTHLDECGFFKSLVMGPSHSSIFRCFLMLFVLRSSCNSFCGCVRRWSTFTYTSILTRSPGPHLLYPLFCR